VSRTRASRAFFQRGRSERSNQSNQQTKGAKK